MQAAFPGLGAIALDALTRREWVKEDKLAQQLKVHPKVLRRVLRYLEQVRMPASSNALVTYVFCYPAGCSLVNQYLIRAAKLVGLLAALGGACN